MKVNRDVKVQTDDDAGGANVVEWQCVERVRCRRHRPRHLCVSVCVCVCTRACVRVYGYIYVYIHGYIHTYIFTSSATLGASDKTTDSKVRFHCG